MSYGPGTESFLRSYVDPAQGGDPSTPLRFFALDFWNGSPAQGENFRTTAGITYPCLLLAGANGIGTAYATSYDAFFVVDGEGIIRYRRNVSDGPPTWRPEEVGPVVDQALADLRVPVPEVPGRGFRLRPAYPNPFNPATVIPYKLLGSGEPTGVRLQILDLRGLVVRTLVAERQATGTSYQVRWDGRDDTGRVVPSAIYLAQLTVAGRSAGRFLTLLK